MIEGLNWVLTLYVTSRAVYELYANQRDIKLKGGVYQSLLHANQHMAMILGIIGYNVFMMIVFYLLENITVNQLCNPSLFFCALIFSNMLFLIALDHFKQERLNETKKMTFYDLFKF